ncbi:ceramide glucosyltransferase [Rhizobium sp. Root274]|uniref:ceramide glucosyltransferase n=1 Tax=unclassified Rhizobium TaxID=2613769 RepID=UPI0007130ED0|nr:MULTISPECIES: ceramide glucosyltransferase [unclassified Rhizobium]KQW29229.1 ceramide glucosyltransferase [Rhizobium sp. Root1240]KRD29425.1 ceramide glucosyltransferase [Rhizobium sp. Root274]
MTLLIWFAATALVVQLGSVALALVWRQRNRTGSDHLATRPPVTLLRPICGEENNLERCLASSFTLDWPTYEIIFCVAEEGDPAAATARRLIEKYPQVPARLLIGEDRMSVNPKMNNLVKGWRSARHDWIVLADSNVLMPPDHFTRMLSRWDEETGLVCSPPVGTEPQGFGAMVESVWLNSFQARWQLLADSMGFGFAQGKSMLFNRHLMSELGGFERLGEEVAEDAAATLLVRNAGLTVRLVTQPFEQPLGRRNLSAVWKRQLRWARLRRASFPLYFLPEILTGAALPATAVIALSITGALPLLAVPVYLALWYGAEALLSRAYQWPNGARALPAMLLRDLALPVLFVAAWFGNGFVWRGNAMTVAEDRPPLPRRLRTAVRRTTDKARAFVTTRTS